MHARKQCVPNRYPKPFMNASNICIEPSQPHHSCTSSFIIFTSSPGLNGGNPTYGHPSHLNASPSEQLPHDPVFPCTVKSVSSSSSSGCSLRMLSFLFASALRELSSASSWLESPQEQSLQAFRRFLAIVGLHPFAGIVSGLFKQKRAGKRGRRGHVRSWTGRVKSSSDSNSSSSISSSSPVGFLTPSPF